MVPTNHTKDIQKLYSSLIRVYQGKPPDPYGSRDAI